MVKMYVFIFIFWFVVYNMTDHRKFVKIQQVNNSLEKGLFAKKEFNEGEIVLYLEGTLLRHPTRESIRIGCGIHIHDELGAYINHSFNPTTMVSGGRIMAIKKIKIDDEITFDYNSNEIDMANPFYCDGIYVCGK